MSHLTRTLPEDEQAVDEKKLEHFRELAVSPTAPVAQWKTWHNNANPKWWKDKGLRLCLLNISILFGSIYANGFDSALTNSLQANGSWISHFDAPKGSLLGAIISAYAFPVLLFPLIGSYFADKIGRKPVLFAASLLGIIGPIISSAGSSVGTFIGGRLITGVACAFFQVTAPPLVAELAHPRFRAVVSALYLCCFYIGAIVCAWVGLGMVEWGHSQSWRVLTALQVVGVVPLVFWIASPWSAESPRYLIKKGRREEALRVLAQLHANGDTEDELVQNELQEIVLAIEAEKAANRDSYLEFFRTPGNRKRLYLVVWFSWAQSMSGNNIFASYLAIILNMVGVTSYVQIQSLISGLFMWLGLVSYVAALFVEKIGRRPLVLWSGALLVIFFAALTGCTAGFANTGSAAVGVAGIPFIFISLTFYCSAMVPLPYLYVTEILPFKLRSKGLAIFSILTSIGQIFNAYVNAIALEAIGWKYYLVFIGTDIVQLVIAYSILVETKGHTLEEIAVVFDKEDTVLHPVHDAGRPFLALLFGFISLAYKIFAFLVYPGAQILDLMGPLDVLHVALSSAHPDLPVTIETKLIAATSDAVTMNGDVKVIPDLTYEQALSEEWHGVMVPGGPGCRPWLESNVPTVEFLQRVVPRLSYVLTVCTGSWLLARTGHLSGHKATTNKSAFNLVKQTTEFNVKWIPKARWTVSGKFWTSSGVTAGQDMASAFVRDLLSQYLPAAEAKAAADRQLGILEISEVNQDDDPWADFYNLA